METIKIKDIIIGERFRESYSDVESLAESIRNVGLVHPIVINNEGFLIAGYRRIKAYESLDIEDIPCRIVDADHDQIKRMEADENIERIDLTNSEIHSVYQYFHETESEPGKRTDLAPPTDSDGGLEPREKTAKATGKSTDTISKINQIMEAKSDDPETQKEIEEIRARIDEQSVDKSYREIKELTTKETKTSYEIMISAADGLDRWLNKHMMEKPLFPYLKEIKGIADKIRQDSKR